MAVAAKDSYGESTLLQRHSHEEEEEDEEETLSLCDLPIYSAESVSCDLSKEKNDDSDLFEFLSEEFVTSSIGPTAKNIIFCGKLIPFKDPSSHDGSNSNTKCNSFEGNGSKSYGCEYGSIRKVKLVRSRTKSRWFLFMFGMSKFSTTEMQLGDIRKRQSRRVPSSMFPAPEKRRNEKGMWKALKSISLVLGCSNGTKIANDVVKAAFV